MCISRSFTLPSVPTSKSPSNLIILSRDSHHHLPPNNPSVSINPTPSTRSLSKSAQPLWRIARVVALPLNTTLTRTPSPINSPMPQQILPMWKVRNCMRICPTHEPLPRTLRHINIPESAASVRGGRDVSRNNIHRESYSTHCVGTSCCGESVWGARGKLTQ